MSIEFSKIMFVVFDFDGVFTDNKVIIDEDGREAVVCNRSDGIGLSRLREVGVDTLILSTEVNNVVKKRAEKLKIDCIHGCKDKLEQLKTAIKEKKISSEQVAFVGNDINDAECLKHVGLPIVVADAHKEVLPLGKYRTELNGGQGAVREICDLIYNAKKRGEQHD
ncbi:MAG: KdsC family phosphatase [Candidatus Helarchaeota archaeon]